MSWSSYTDGEEAGCTVPVVPKSQLGEILAFRQFQVIPSARQLLASGREVEIGGRAFDLLLVLLEARGTVVDKVKIFQRVWPSIAVDESNLRFQMGALRRVLGTDRDAIKTIAGRGYMLVDERPPGQAAVLDNGPKGNEPPRGDSLQSADDEDVDASAYHVALLRESEAARASLEVAPSALVRIRALERENDWLRRAVADLIIGRQAKSYDLR